ncbi:hypothetical protein C450_07967 [Halococcus salifodinae DSM 8989]|uniref:Uncharacterized protein n=1 Tax=Halococcus salifodinae DSM 8989 TaxID=1227456 RepID=M0N7Y4_9EURY|nr:hypothetical protein C450_07967 [Halococcus salifodinae DSM 8989]
MNSLSYFSNHTIHSAWIRQYTTYFVHTLQYDKRSNYLVCQRIVCVLHSSLEITVEYFPVIDRSGVNDITDHHTVSFWHALLLLNL